jgi:hypothetical protein
VGVEKIINCVPHVFERRADPGGEVQPGDSMRGVILFILVAGLIDTGLSHWEISTGLALEANPLVLCLLDRGGWETYWTVKCAVLFLGCGILRRYRAHGLSQVGSIIVASIYVLVLAWHAAGLLVPAPP